MRQYCEHINEVGSEALLAIISDDINVKEASDAKVKLAFSKAPDGF